MRIVLVSHKKNKKFCFAREERESAGPYHGKLLP